MIIHGRITAVLRRDQFSILVVVSKLVATAANSPLIMKFSVLVAVMLEVL